MAKCSGLTHLAVVMPIQSSDLNFTMRWIRLTSFCTAYQTTSVWLRQTELHSLTVACFAVSLVCITSLGQEYERVPPVLALALALALPVVLPVAPVLVPVTPLHNVEKKPLALSSTCSAFCERIWYVYDSYSLKSWMTRRGLLDCQ